MTVTVRTPYKAATVGGTNIPSILSCSCSFGYDISVSSAQIRVGTADLPGGIDYWQRVLLTMGATQGTAALRFDGLLTGLDYTLYPGDVVLKCSGWLSLADQYENQHTAGTDVTNGSLGAIDADPVTPNAPLCIAAAVLAIAGVYDPFGSYGTTCHLLGTGQLLGTVTETDYLWSQGETALSYLQRIEEIAKGYRTFDCPPTTIGMVSGITVQRVMVSTAIPGSPTIAATFTEGVDIYKATAPQTVLPSRNQVVVQGFTDPTGTTMSKVVTAGTTNFPLPPGVTVIPHDLTSRLLEFSSIADLPAGTGISCEDAGDWLIGELNQLQIKAQLETPRDDFLVPGQIIAVLAPNRLNLGSGSTPLNMWLQNVTTEITETNVYTQRLTLLRGAE